MQRFIADQLFTIEEAKQRTPTNTQSCQHVVSLKKKETERAQTHMRKWESFVLPTLQENNKTWLQQNLGRRHQGKSLHLCCELQGTPESQGPHFLVLQGFSEGLKLQGV